MKVIDHWIYGDTPPSFLEYGQGYTDYQFYCHYCGGWLWSNGTVHPEDHHNDMDDVDEIRPERYRWLQ